MLVISSEDASPLVPEVRVEQAAPICCEMNAGVKVKNEPANKKKTPQTQPLTTASVSQGVGLNSFSSLKLHLICPPEDVSLQQKLNRWEQGGNKHRNYLFLNIF